jgi:hypothetical protein
LAVGSFDPSPTLVIDSHLLEIGGWPGLVQTAGIDAIKAQFFDQLQNDGLGSVVIARNWQGDASGRACRPAQFEKKMDDIDCEAA